MPITITIYEGYDKSYIMLGSKDARFHKAWGDVVKIPTSNVYKELENIASWVNNILGEACLFEIG